MIYGINFINICMSDILACVECVVGHCTALKWGVTKVGKLHYWALLTSSWDPLSGTEDALGDGTHPEP